MIETMTGVDPARTHALLVGIEEYETRHRPIPGAGADCLGHARWLTGHGVPPDQIHLCLTPLTRNRDTLLAGLRELGVTHHRTATELDVRDVLQKELRGLDADLLWLAWSGHGVLTSDQQGELLVLADGETALPSWNLRDALLHSQAYDNIARKVLLFDACRLKAPDSHDYGLTTLAGAAHKPRRRTGLVTLHATQSGSAAYSDPAGGLFTRAFLEQLRQAPAWPADPVTVAHAVDPVLRADGRQTLTVDDDHWTGARFRPAPPVGRPDSLRTHTEALTRLGAKGKYLTDTLLPYLPPEPGHETAPDTILARLADHSASSESVGYRDRLRGILLTGPAGAGKTRTCLEVAQHALTQGWQVFHPRQDDGLRAGELLDGVRQAADLRPGSPVLLVLDYLDRYHRLDLRELADLLHAEAEHGLRIACVASVRPGALKDLGNRGWRSLFAVVELRSDEERRHALAAHIFRTVAPKAYDTLGHRRTADLCTTHPVLALLLSLELERLADTGALDPTATDVPRPGALIDWFDRRTREDLGPAHDLAERLAATAAALTCVHTRDAVEAAADTALRRRPAAVGTTGRQIVARLKAHGWLLTAEEQDTDDALDTIHDIVTDLFLSETCLPDGYTLDPDTPGELLDAVSDDMRSLRRAVGHLSRWGTDLKGNAPDDLARACTTWLHTHETDVRTLLRDHLDDGMSTLVAMISATPWRQAVAAHWNTLVTPLLDETDPARVRGFLTAAALNYAEAPAELLRSAEAWLTAHTADDPDAIHLVNALAHATTDDYEQYVAAPARDWLHHHGLTREGRARIHTLLRHTGHSPAIDAEAAATAVELAHELRHEAATEHLLSTLHRIDHVPPTALVRLAKATHEWLVKHGTQDRATYIYGAALTNPQLPDVAPIAAFALEWLRTRDDKTEVSFVLRALLKCNKLPDHLTSRAVAQAQEWLAADGNGLKADASFVLGPLLHETVLLAAPEAAATSAEAGLAWLAEHPQQPYTDFVLSHLLKYPDFAEADPDRADVARVAVQAALDWLTARDTWAGRTLSALLVRSKDMTPEQRFQAVELILARMRAAPRTEPDDSYVHRRLLFQNDLTDTQYRDALRHARQWLDVNSTGVRAGYVLSICLHRAARADDTDALGSVVELALDWLDHHGTTEDAAHVVRNLYLPDRFQPTEHLDAVTVARRAADHALRWTRAHPAHEDSYALLCSVLNAADEIGPDQARTALDVTKTWLAARPRTAERAYQENRILHRLLFMASADADTDAAAIRCATDRIDLKHPQPYDADILRTLMYRRKGDPEIPDPAVVRAAFRLLAGHAPGETDFKLIGCLLHRHELPLDQRQAAVAHAMTWLGSPHGTVQGAILVLGPLLTALLHLPPPHPDVLPAALAWMTEHDHRSGVRGILHGLVTYDPDLARHPELRQRAATWLAARPDATDDIRTALAPYLS
ncbi:caspase family protein [Streptomyces sp. NPDC050803]|uniref:caspase family protein n=1 Tax=unclassified Streptomyces TaxID=2593676 RepID=UPI0034202286